MTQEEKGKSAPAAQPGPETAPAVTQEATPPSTPEDGRITFETQEALDKVVNDGRADLGRKLKAAEGRIAEQDTEIANIGKAQEGIRTTQRQAQLDAAKDDAEAQAQLRKTFADEDKDTALSRRSSDLDVRERQIAANATADNATLAAGKARELEASTGIDASVLLTHALVLDKAEDGTVTVNIERMEALAGTLKGAGTEKGIEAVGANTPAAVAAAASDKDFMRDWGKGNVPSTAENQKRADRVNQSLSTTV